MQTPDSIAAIWPLLLGWFLGLFSPMIVESMKKEREANEIRITILKELNEIRYQLSLAVYLVFSHHGSYSRSNLVWLNAQLLDFKEKDGVDKAFAYLNMVLALTDAQIIRFAMEGKTKAGKSPALKKYETPVLDSKFSSFTYLDKELQSRLMEIHLKFNLLNQIVDEYRIYFQLTFTASVDSEKEKQLTNNLDSSLIAFRQQAVMIIDSIQKLELRLSNG